MMKKESTIWSPYQQAIFEDVQLGVGNTIVIARAGAGKSTVLVEAVKYIPKRQKTLFVAFNRSVAEELDERINKSYIDISTLHSFGCRAIMAAFGKVAIYPDKTLDIVKGLLHESGIKLGGNERFNIVASLIKTVGICKAGVIDTPSKIDILLDEYDIDTFELDRAGFIRTVCQTLRRCKEDKAKIDFGDMIWFPTIFNIPTKTYDRVFIDEANDLSFAQVNLALGACKKGGRVLAVADDRQVLYRWAGVDIDAVSVLTKRLNAKVLPLPISYRCPKAVIKLAQEIVPDIQAAPNAKEGSVQNISEDIFLSFVKPGDFILSRVNAPLIYYCMELLRNKIPANILGKDIASGLLFMIKRSEANTVDEFLVWLDKWKKSEVERLSEKNRDPILVLDKVACLEHLCRGAKSLDKVKSNIKDMFSDDENEKTIVWLSSIHKFKGGEADTVYVLANTLKRGKNTEEDNLAYVSWTRAKKTLYLVK
jgi:DNA helicase II / ATP-dependent DNA helicase PcrA